MTNIQVIPNDSLDNDATIIIPGGTKRDNAWLTVDLGPDRPKYSLNIVSNDGYLEVEVFFEGGEDGPEETSCVVYDADKSGSDGEGSDQ